MSRSFLVMTLALLLLVLTLNAVPSTAASPLLSALRRPTGPVNADLSPPSFPAAAPSANQCGLGSLDFSSLTADKDWVGLQGDYSEIYYLALCRNVSNLWCTLNPQTAAVQVCQVASGDTSSTYSLMSSSLAATNWSYINGKDATQGVRFESETGDGGGCPNNRRRGVVGNLVCGNTTGVIADITEGPTCTYVMTLPTPMLCVKEGQEPQHFAQVENVRRALAARELRQARG